MFLTLIVYRERLKYSIKICKEIIKKRLTEDFSKKKFRKGERTKPHALRNFIKSDFVEEFLAAKELDYLVKVLVVLV